MRSARSMETIRETPLRRPAPVARRALRRPEATKAPTCGRPPYEDRPYPWHPIGYDVESCPCFLCRD